MRPIPADGPPIREPTALRSGVPRPQIVRQSDSDPSPFPHPRWRARPVLGGGGTRRRFERCQEGSKSRKRASMCNKILAASYWRSTLVRGLVRGRVPATTQSVRRRICAHSSWSGSSEKQVVLLPRSWALSLFDLAPAPPRARQRWWQASARRKPTAPARRDRRSRDWKNWKAYADRGLFADQVDSLVKDQVPLEKPTVCIRMSNSARKR